MLKLLFAAALLHFPGAAVQATTFTVIANANLKFSPATLTINAGDTVIFNRAGVGDISPSSTPGVGFAPASDLTGPDAPTRDMATDFAGQYGFLPILLEDGAGLVYNGYLQLGMDTPSGLPNDPPAIHVDYVVYNENAGEPITMALVPEPGGVTGVVMAGFLVLRRRGVSER